MYTCTECARLLYRFLDGELEETELTRIRLHLEGCPQCRGRVHFEGAVRRTIGRAVRGAACPDELRARLDRGRAPRG